jgi:hypothetical protein
MSKTSTVQSGSVFNKSIKSKVSKLSIKSKKSRKSNKPTPIAEADNDCEVEEFVSPRKEKKEDDDSQLDGETKVADSSDDGSEEQDVLASFEKLPTVVKFDVDNESCITYMTESSAISQGPPSSVASSDVTDSSQLAMRLNFLAR